MSKAENSPYTFGNRNSFDAKLISSREQGFADATVEDVTIPRRSEIREVDYIDALSDAANNWRIATDTETGKTFEISTIKNRRFSLPGVVLELSTYSSGLSINDGNLVEFAENQVASQRDRAYVSSFGNGGTSYYDREELAYIKKTGRFTETVETSGGHVVQELPTIRALARVLEEEGIEVTHQSANSAGFAAARGLMSMLKEDSIEAAYFKSPTNIRERPLSDMLKGVLIVDGIINGRRLAKETRDPRRADGRFDELREQARSMATNIYGEAMDEKDREIIEANPSHGLKKLINDAIIYGRGERQGDPAIKDLLLAVRRQPNARMTMHIPSHDSLYDSSDELKIIKRWHKAAAAINKLSNLQVLYMPGTHADHTYYPTMRQSVEYYALNEPIAEAA